MGRVEPASHGATIDDLLAVAEEKPYYELLGGVLEQKTAPLFRHGRLQRILGAQLGKHFGDEAEPGEPGGWWIGSEVHVQLAPDVVVVPDCVGWRMERVPELPDAFPVTIRPDWICEILSPSNPARDTIRKLRLYHEAKIPHYWIADPERQQLSVFRWQPEAYLLVLNTQPPEIVRPEPFDAVEFPVAALLGVRQ